MGMGKEIRWVKELIYFTIGSYMMEMRNCSKEKSWQNE